jgi:chromosome segregation ATPase
MSQGIPSARARCADLALATYLAPILEGRRVAVVGPASGEVARRARVLGAQTVVSFGGVGEDIAVRALTPGAIASFHGRLDVILVPDAGAVPSLVAVLDEARRALGSEGVVVVGSEPDDAPVPMEHGGKRSVGYHDLHDLCEARFANVRMLGRGPFLGYTVATLDEDGDGVALDTRLIDGDPPRPEAFVAVASDSLVALDPLAVVQVPGELITQIRAGATKALEDALAQREQKLKEVEAASAERGVRIQRYEHGIKELEEENRKARDKTVRMSKELEDERKLRQRVELEAQMNRRAPELPKANESEAELKKLREAAAQVERALAEARKQADENARALAEARKQADESARALEALRKERDAAHDEAGELKGRVTTSETRIHDLERELDETQAIEADLRAQLDEALERVEVIDRGPEVEVLRQRLSALEAALTDHHGDAEYVRLETELAARADENLRFVAENQRLEQALRELALTIEHTQKRPAAEEVEDLRARLSTMASVHAALADKAEEVVKENAILRERVAQAEAQALTHAGEVQQARWRVGELEAEVARLGVQADKPTAVQVDARGDIDAVRAELDAARENLRQAQSSVEEGARASEQRAAEAARLIEEQRVALHEARNEVSRLYTLNVGLEARVVHRQVELEGLRAGFNRRVRELEHEVEQLVRALEVAGTQVAFEAKATRDTRDRELDALRAEHQGALFRLREAEGALDEIRAARPAETTASPEPDAPEVTTVATIVGVPEEVHRALEAERDDLLARLQRAETALAERASEPALAMPDDLHDDGEGLAVTAEVGGARFEQLMQDLSATAERLAQTEERIAQLEQERDEARLAVDHERSRNAAAVSEEVRSLNERIASLKMEADTMCEALERSVVDRTERENLVVKLRAEVDAIRMLLDKAQAERAERDERVEASASEHTAALAALEQARADRDERDARIAALQSELSALHASAEGAAAERARREAQAAALQEELADLRAKVEGASADLAARQQETAALAGQLAAAQGELASARDRVRAQEADFAELRTSLDQLAAERADTARAQEAHAAEVSELRERVTRAIEERAELERALGVMRGELEGLQGELDAARAQAANPSEADGLRAALGSAQAALVRTQSERDEADRRFATAQAEADAARDRLEKSLAERGQREQQTATLIEQLNERDARLALIERRRAEELASLQKSLTMETQVNRTLRNSLESVRAGLSSILVDGRGAMVAHDLMTLLKRIEENNT